MMLGLCMIGVVLGWCTEIDPRAVNPPWLYGYIFFALVHYELLKLNNKLSYKLT